MFSTRQILTATRMRNSFSQISKALRRQPQALLITQKGGNHLVLVNAEIFQELIDFKLHVHSSGFQDFLNLEQTNE